MFLNKVLYSFQYISSAKSIPKYIIVFTAICMKFPLYFHFLTGYCKDREQLPNFMYLFYI